MIPPDTELRDGDRILIVPSLSLYFLFEVGALRNAAADVLEVYQQARAVLGDALSHVDVDGRGRYRPLNKRLETMVPTWLERPQPKRYWAEFWGAATGVTAASLSLNLDWMDPWTTDIRAARKEFRDWKVPWGKVSCVQITLPLDHPLAVNGGLIDWVARLSLVRGDILAGIGGLSLNWFYGLQSTSLGASIGRHYESICRRFPGFELEPRSGLLNSLVQWDNHRDDYVYRIPRIGWMTLLGPRILSELGGASILTAAISDGDVRIVDLSPTRLLVAGPSPDCGDLAAGRLPSAYLSVGRALRWARAPSWRLRFERKLEWVDEWQRTFDGAPSEG